MQGVYFGVDKAKIMQINKHTLFKFTVGEIAMQMSQ